MKDKLVSLEVAYKLKDLGFDWQCRYSIDISDNKEYTNGIYNTNKELESLNRINTPELWQVNKWLREVQFIFIEISVDKTTSAKFFYKISYLDVEWKFVDISKFIYSSYEEALEEAIATSIKNH